MRYIILLAFAALICGCKTSTYLQKSTVKLSQPVFAVNHNFFDGITQVSISPTDENAEIVYSLNDGSQQTYQTPIEINATSKICARAIGDDFITSDSSAIELIKLPKSKLNSISSERPLNEKYGNGGLDILIDLEQGQSDFNKDWLGYLGGKISYDIAFDDREVSHIIISTLRNQSAWIFSPHYINVYYDGNVIANHEISGVNNELENANVFTKIKLPELTTDKLTIEIIAPKEIPAWHPGVGTKPWIFLDEILIY